MAGTKQDDSEEITGINVTPLVDVMLVLLIIFMVTSTYITTQGIRVTLPQAASGETVDTLNLAFVVDKDSRLFLDGKELSFAEIGSAIDAKRQGSTKALQALIGADQATPHGTVVRVIDLVRQHGIVDFALNIDAEDAEVKP
jgi:biopolymer transport protein ExbD